MLYYMISFKLFIAQVKPQFYVVYSFVQSAFHENAHTYKQYKYTNGFVLTLLLIFYVLYLFRTITWLLDGTLFICGPSSFICAWATRGTQINNMHDESHVIIIIITILKKN